MVNMGGLGLGPPLAAIAATIAWPLRLPFWLDLALLVPALAAILLIQEPVAAPAPVRRVRLRPQRLSVPVEMRGTFVSAALAGFAGFAVLGLSTAVSPAFLGKTLGVTSLIVVGLVVFSGFAASTAGQLLLEVVPPARAVPAGCAGLIAGMAFLALGLAAASLPLLVIGIVVAGAGQGLSFRAALATVNSAAPPERRGEVASSFFVICYVALSLPVIGEGVLAEIAGLRTAGLVFAAVMAAIAAVVLVLLARQRRAAAPV
jgi:MFS family permease